MAHRFHNLAEEVVDLIFEQIALDTPESLINIRLVSKQFNCSAIPFLYRSLVLSPFKQESILLPTSNILTNIITHTRELEIKGSLRWPHLVDLLRNLERLNSLRWNAWTEPIPISVLLCLREFRPETRLYVEGLPVARGVYDLNMEQRNLEILNSLVGSQEICSIKADIFYENASTIMRLKEALISLSNLEVLHLRYPREQENDMWPREVTDLRVLEGEKLSSLKELVYECCDSFDSEKLIPSSFFDFTQLRHLELRGKSIYSFVKSLQNQITILKTLKIERFCWAEDFEEATEILEVFLENIRGLVILELINSTIHRPGTRLVSTITQQGETLKILSIYRPRRTVDRYYVQLDINQFSHQELDNIRTSCPNMSSLTLDMAIIDDEATPYPYDFLSAIARFPSLESLRLYVVLGQYESSHFETDTKTVRHIAAYLYRFKIGIPFRKIEIIVGEYFKDFTNMDEPSRSSRPELLFLCQKGDNGEIVITDDSHSIPSHCWRSYFDAASDRKSDSRTWPKDIDEWNRLEREADRAMSGIEEANDDAESLFGNEED